MAADTASLPPHARLVRGGVVKTLLSMSVSMLLGFLFNAAFNLVDTYFVARLGTRELAAMGYTFPLVMVIHGLIMGIGMGAASVISRAIGQGDQHRVRQLTMHALLLGIVWVVFFIGLGYLTMRPVVRLLGASPEILPLTIDYLSIWFAGMLFLIIPMVGNNIIRATGDTLSPSLVMGADLALNIVLDPIFIFGWGPVPALGIRGAALATVLSRLLALVASLYILHYRKSLLTRPDLHPRAVWRSWKQILYIGLPAGVTNLLTPLTAGLVTRIVSGFGTASVAALSAGTRLEQIAAIPIIAFGASLLPFIGQNWGAGSYDRIEKARRLSISVAAVWGAICVVFFGLLSPVIAARFSRETEVIEPLVLYLRIIPFAIGFRGLIMCANQSMNAINRPLDSSGWTLIRLLGLQVPLAFLGARIGAFPGLLLGIVLSEVIAALAANRWVKHLFRRLAS
ncbi:MATE family efflux transporter [candidate division KSB1 bacterium]|nr:MATE family efflux transporter [candidate division KSB1 bacterium]